jgi:hypothetical protein
MVTSGTDAIGAWTQYLKTAPGWQELVKGITPKATDCGPVYELPSPIDRPNEGFAISDMRDISVAGPHYHATGYRPLHDPEWARPGRHQHSSVQRG